jgi:hypothetical protein
MNWQCTIASSPDDALRGQLSEYLGQMFGKGIGKHLREPQHVLGIEVGDDEPEVASRRQCDHGRTQIVRHELCSRYRTLSDQQRGQRAAVAKDHVPKAAALIDTVERLEWFVEDRQRERGGAAYGAPKRRPLRGGSAAPRG